jgi:hypothetical protein
MELNLPKEKIREISQDLNMGMDCYIHKNGQEIITIPNERNYDYDYDDADNPFKEDQDKVEENFEDYIKIEPMNSHESFQIMEDFMESLEDSNMLKNILAGALSRDKPFSRFKGIINDSGEFRQKWFDFEKQKWIEYVEDSLREWDNLEEEGEEDL